MHLRINLRQLQTRCGVSQANERRANAGTLKAITFGVFRAFAKIFGN